MTYTATVHQMIVTAADAYAEAAHARVGQKRKYSDEPYIIHPRQAAQYVEASIHSDAITIAVALLHDVLEDTLEEGQTVQDGADAMREHFTAVLADSDIAHAIVVGVLEVTDISKPEDGNRKFRKEMDRDHAGRAHATRKTVKLADIKSNMPSIVKNDPGFARKWVSEKADVYPLLGDGDPELFKEVGDMIMAYFDGRFDPDAYEIV